jgi:cell filamentation protein
MFDPFGDFETLGYLQNVERLKDRHLIDRQQHLHFRAGLNEAVSVLARCSPITYGDFCEVHRILFGGFYPWAGRDRLTLGVGDIISKREGGLERVRFEHAALARNAVEEGLRIGNNPEAMAQRPGHVMGYFAWGHPFLEGNGRTMMVVHAELLHRAGYVIDWRTSLKGEYLDALTRELEDPRLGVLDAYMRLLVRRADPSLSWIAQLSAMPGLDGGDSDTSDAVSYSSNDPRGRAQYEAAVRARKGGA